MRTGQPIISRPAWYDRNPIQQVDYYGNILGPHSAVTRLTYTVPAGKKAMVELITIEVRRETAPTTVDEAGIYIALSPGGSGTKEILAVSIESATVGAYDGKGLGTSIILLTGDRLDFVDSDLSTGGTVLYYMTYKITEFDA